jgi:hypothetical protein
MVRPIHLRLPPVTVGVCSMCLPRAVVYHLVAYCLLVVLFSSLGVLLIVVGANIAGRAAESIWARQGCNDDMYALGVAAACCALLRYCLWSTQLQALCLYSGCMDGCLAGVWVRSLCGSLTSSVWLAFSAMASLLPVWCCLHYSSTAQLQPTCAQSKYSLAWRAACPAPSWCAAACLHAAAQRSLRQLLQYQSAALHHEQHATSLVCCCLHTTWAT